MPRSALQTFIHRALASNPALAGTVCEIAERYPETGPAFQQVIECISRGLDTDARPTKRAKTEHVEGEHDMTTIAAQDDKSNATTSMSLLTLPGISLVTPLRKKLTLDLTGAAVCFRHPESGNVEATMKYQDMDLATILPIPDKSAKMYNVCLFSANEAETIVFTVPDSRPVDPVAASSSIDSLHDPTFANLVAHVLNDRLAPFGNKAVMHPSREDFISAVPQAHRKHEPGLFLTAHRGSKEGFLFFLPWGIVYGFKRPMLHIQLQDIVSITYNDILQRTFNLTVVTRVGTDEKTIEFSMIDVAEHDGVDKYIQKYRLSDASLSESRRAKLPSTASKSPGVTSEISRAADEIASSINGHDVKGADEMNGEDDDDDEEEDGDFEDSVSHDGSTIASSDVASEDIEHSDQQDESDSNLENTE